MGEWRDVLEGLRDPAKKKKRERERKNLWKQTTVWGLWERA